jgi:hypothetical protein
MFLLYWSIAITPFFTGSSIFLPYQRLMIESIQVQGTKLISFLIHVLWYHKKQQPVTTTTTTTTRSNSSSTNNQHHHHHHTRHSPATSTISFQNQQQNQQQQQPSSSFLIRDAEWYESIHLVYSALLNISMLTGHTLITMLEGRVYGVFSLIFSIVLLFVGATYKDAKYIRFCNRITVIVQAWTNCFETLSLPLIRRGIMIRFLADACHIEALDEIFVSMTLVAFNLAYGKPTSSSDEVSRFVLVLFVMVAIPMTLIPIRGATARFLNSTNNPSFVGFLLWFTTQVIIFSLNFHKNIVRIFSIHVGPIVGGVLIATSLALFTWNFSRYGVRRVLLVQTTFKENLPMYIACVSFMVEFLMIALAIHPNNNNTNNILRNRDVILSISIITISIIITTGMTNTSPRIIILAWVFRCTLALTANSTTIATPPTPTTTPPTLLPINISNFLLISTYVLLGFNIDDRPIRVLAADSILLVGIKMALDGKTMFVDIICLLLSLSVASMTSTLKDLGQRACQLEVQAQQFLDHALKQKFAGVTSAVEHTLELVQAQINLVPLSDKTKRANLLTFKSTLEEAVAESKWGHDLCYAANVIAKITQGTYISKSHDFRYVHEVFDDLSVRVRTQLSPKMHVEVLDFDAMTATTLLRVDWDLLWLFVMLLVDRNPKNEQEARMVISILHRRTGTDLCVRFSRGVPPGRVVVQNVRRLVAKMDATVTYTATSAILMLQDVSIIEDQSGGGNPGEGQSVGGDHNAGSSSGGGGVHSSSHTNNATINHTPGSGGTTLDYLSMSPSTFSSIVAVGIPGTSTSSSIMTNNNISGNPALMTIPQRLIFAVLDDVSLVRKNLMRLLSALKASPDSFALGATEEEVRHFKDFVMGIKPVLLSTTFGAGASGGGGGSSSSGAGGTGDVDESTNQSRIIHPDVIIVDMYLEYDTRNDPILGGDIAMELRHAGFMGCVIMHSANEALRNSLDPRIFDGFLSKTFNKDDIASVVVKSLQHARARRAFGNHHNKDMLELRQGGSNSGTGGGTGSGGGSGGGGNPISSPIGTRIVGGSPNKSGYPPHHQLLHHANISASTASTSTNSTAGMMYTSSPNPSRILKNEVKNPWF